MTRLAAAWRLAALALLAPLPVQGQVLEIEGDVRTPVRFTPADISSRPHVGAEMTIHDTTHVYRGVPLYDLLAEAGLPEGRDVVRTVVIAQAPDGYEAVFSLAELHPDFTNRVVLVADSVGGRPLAAEHGPFRLVVPGETEGARAVWSLSRLEVRTLR